MKRFLRTLLTIKVVFFSLPETQFFPNIFIFFHTSLKIRVAEILEEKNHVIITYSSEFFA